MQRRSLFPFFSSNYSKHTGLTAYGTDIKEATREHRGCGTRTKVSEQTKMPKKWSDFLQVSKNKQELFTFLSNKVSTGMNIPEGKSGYITSGKHVISTVCM